jgi:hypothetical protein
MNLENLTEGPLVHYVLNRGEHRPAFIVKVWDKARGTVNLIVLIDGSNDWRSIGREGPWSPMIWETSKLYSEEPKPGTWHFPEPEPFIMPNLKI